MTTHSQYKPEQHQPSCNSNTHQVARRGDYWLEDEQTSLSVQFKIILIFSVGKASSSAEHLTCGVPQGSSLGPLLFLFMCFSLWTLFANIICIFICGCMYANACRHCERITCEILQQTLTRTWISVQHSKKNKIYHHEIWNKLILTCETLWPPHVRC